MKDYKVIRKYGRCEYTVFDDGAYLVYNLYVNVWYRRRGCARKLLQGVFNCIRKNVLGPYYYSRATGGEHDDNKT